MKDKSLEELKEEDRLKAKKAGLTFPNRYNIILYHENGVNNIGISEFSDKKIQLKNIKFNKTKVIIFSASATVSLGIFDIESYDDYCELIEKLEKQWSVPKKNE